MSTLLLLLSVIKPLHLDTLENKSSTRSDQTLGGELTEMLRDAIVTGDIPQGSKLSETKLAQKYEVSRGPLREAIRRLEGMNLIQHKPQQGVRVVSLNLELILDIYEAREALESKAVALAAKNMSSAEIDKLYRILDIQASHLKATAAARVPAESDYAFHEALIYGSKNRVIQHALINQLYHLIKMFRYQNADVRESFGNALTEHRQIAYAVEQRDADLARISMQQHIKRARDKIYSRLCKRTKPPTEANKPW